MAKQHDDGDDLFFEQVRLNEQHQQQILQQRQQREQEEQERQAAEKRLREEEEKRQQQEAQRGLRLSRDRDFGEDRDESKQNGNNNGQNQNNQTLELEKLSEQERRQAFEQFVNAQNKEELLGLNETQKQAFIEERINKLESEYQQLQKQPISSSQFLQQREQPNNKQQPEFEQLSESERRQVFEQGILAQKEQELAQLNEQQQREYLDRQVQELERQFQNQQYQRDVELQRAEPEKWQQQRREQQTQPQTPNAQVEARQQDTSAQAETSATRDNDLKNLIDKQPERENPSIREQAEKPIKKAEKSIPERDRQDELKPETSQQSLELTGNQLSLAEVKNWYYNGRASDKFQIEAGIEQPRENMTPAQLMYQQRQQSEQREKTASELTSQTVRETSQKTGKPVANEEVDPLKSQYLQQLDRHWQEQNHQRLQDYNQSRSGEKNTVSVRLRDLEQWKTEAQVLGRSPNELTKIDKIIADARQNNDKGIAAIHWHDASLMKRDRQEFAHQAEITSIRTEFQERQFANQRSEWISALANAGSDRTNAPVEEPNVNRKPQQPSNKPVEETSRHSIPRHQTEVAKSDPTTGQTTAKQIASNWKSSLEKIGVEVDSQTFERVENYASRHLERQAEKNLREQLNAKNNHPDQVLVTQAELKEWQAQAKELGRSDTHLAKIDKIANDHWIDHPNDQVAISQADYEDKSRENWEYSMKTPAGERLDSGKFKTTNIKLEPLEEFNSKNINFHNAGAISLELKDDLERAGVAVSDRDVKEMVRFTQEKIETHQKQNPSWGQQNELIFTEGKDLRRWGKDAQSLYENQERSQSHLNKVSKALDGARKNYDKSRDCSVLGKEDYQVMKRDRSDTHKISQKSEQSLQLTMGRGKGRGR